MHYVALAYASTDRYLIRLTGPADYSRRDGTAAWRLAEESVRGMPWPTEVNAREGFSYLLIVACTRSAASRARAFASGSQLLLSA